MPLPVYFICSQSGAIDQATNLASAFNILETVQIAQIRPTTAPIRPNTIRLLAAWMREESDTPDQVFQVDIFGIFPPDGRELQLGQTEFQFTLPLQRLFVDMPLAHFFGPGVLRIEARIRRTGQPEILNTMTFRIILQEAPTPLAQVESSPASALPQIAHQA